MRFSRHTTAISGQSTVWRNRQKGIAVRNQIIRHVLSGIRIAATAFVLMTVMCMSAWAQSIEYDDLRELLIAGNSTLKNSSLTDTIEDLQEEITALETEYGSMKLEYEIYKGEDEATAAKYRQNASAIHATIKNLKKSLDRMTNSHSTNEVMINTLTQTAQTLMCSYKQMEMNVISAQKSYDAAVCAYDAAAARYSVGMASETDVTDALNTMLSRQNTLNDYTIRRDSVRYSFLSLLGITDSSDIVIGDVPAPDLSAIGSVDFASDEATLMSYNTALQSANHQDGSDTLKEAEYTEALGEAYVAAQETYSNLQTQLLQYQAAQESYAAAQAAYAAAQRKKSAGMMTEAEYLSQEAAYLSSYTAYRTQEMNLTQTYANYKWALKGV